MYCGKCGTYNEDSSRFCKHCGNGMRPQESGKGEQTGNKGATGTKRRFLTSFLIGAAAAAVIIACLFALKVLQIGSAEKNDVTIAQETVQELTETVASQGNDQNTLKTVTENEGYDTPEDAVWAFADALKAQDVEKMISTFSIESFNDHYDFDFQVKRMDSIEWNSYKYYPVPENEVSLIRQYNLSLRKERIIQELNRFFEEMAFGEEYEEIVFRNNYSETSSEEVSRYLDSLRDNVPEYSEMTIIGVYFPSEMENRFNIDATLYEKYDSESNKTYLDSRRITYGAENLCDLVLVFELDGEQWLLCPGVVSYEGRWRIVSLKGTFSELFGLSAFSYTIPVSELREDWG